MSVLASAALNSLATAARDAVLDFLFPRVCPLCQSPVGLCQAAAGWTEADGWSRGRSAMPEFCDSCQDSFRIPRGPSCELCAAPVGPFVDSSNGCGECRWTRFAYRRVIRLGLYEDTLRTVCLRAKEAWQEPLMGACGRLMAQQQATALQALKAEILIPIPQHWTHRFTRAHNAAEVLADALADSLGLPVCTGVLERARLTRPQKSLTVAARRSNQRDAFRIADPTAVNGSRVLLVDDILTTGATAHQAARALHRAGASVTGVAVVARVLSRQIPDELGVMG